MSRTVKVVTFLRGFVALKSDINIFDNVLTRLPNITLVKIKPYINRREKEFVSV